jgi:phospholipid-binding lipoprotein MlaA
MRVRKRTRLWLTAMGLASLLAGCATPPPASKPDALAEYRAVNDPLEPFNRTMYSVNTKLDDYAIRPATVAYTNVVPSTVRRGIHNALINLGAPMKLGNDMLQGKPRNAGDTLMRFLINTTAGGLGIFDVAKDLGYPDHDTDFGMTLAAWGVGSGPYLFLPVLGPGSPRDSSGRVVDIAGDPLTYIGQGAGVTAANWSRFTLNLLDARSQYLGAFKQIRRTALDPYATFRSLYRQHRDAQLETARAADQRTVPAWFPRPTPTSTDASPPAPAG